MISYKEWMDGTYVMGYSRGPELKALDQAIMNFNEGIPSTRLAIRDAWNAWEKKTGGKSQLMSSPRNGKGMIEKLESELNAHRVVKPLPLATVKELVKHNQDNLKTLFSGKQLEIKKSKSGAYAIGAAIYSVEKSCSAIKTAAAGANPTEIGQIVNALTEGASGVAQGAVDALTKALPFIRMAKTGFSLASNLKTIAKGAWTKYHQAEEGRSSFAPGDPSAALEAVLQMIGREMQEKALDAVKGAAELAGQVTALLSFGIAVPVALMADFAKSVGELCASIYLFGRDMKEAFRANKLLLDGPLDLSLFKYCPLLGCYLLACSDDSAVIAMAVDQYGKPGWLVDTKLMKEKADPLIEKAGELIRDARYAIPALSYVKKAVPSSKPKLSNLWLAEFFDCKWKLETTVDQGTNFKPVVPAKVEKTKIWGTGAKNA